MPYIQRDKQGKISGLFHEPPQNGESEYVSATHTELVDFLAQELDQNSSKLALAESDREIARITEDLIQLLIEKNLILFTELPTPVQNKLLAREKLRSALQGHTNNFLDESELL